MLSVRGGASDHRHRSSRCGPSADPPSAVGSSRTENLEVRGQLGRAKFFRARGPPGKDGPP